MTQIKAMKSILNQFALFVLAIQIADSAYGFDSTGHMIVQEIALSQLTPVAKQNVETLVGQFRATDDNCAYDIVSIPCWLDDIRNYQKPDFDFRTWHYIEIGLQGEGPQISMKVGDLSNQEENIVTALKRALEVLKGGKDPLIPNKPIALAIVCHLVGDIHQPLHCIAHYFPNGHTEGKEHSPHDEGGNLVSVKNANPTENDKMYPLNLHPFWDSAYRATFFQGSGQVDLESDRIDVTGNLHGDPNERIARHDYRNIADRLNVAAASTIGKVGGNVDFEAWANESHQIAEQIVYGKLTFDPTDKYHLSVSLTADYVVAAREITNRQLNLAGHRLAMVLNEVWK